MLNLKKAVGFTWRATRLQYGEPTMMRCRFFKISGISESDFVATAILSFHTTVDGGRWSAQSHVRSRVDAVPAKKSPGVCGGLSRRSPTITAMLGDPIMLPS